MEQKYVVVGKEVYRLIREFDGFWYDDWGCIWALRDEKASVDHVDRCGVGFISLPKNHPLNLGCKAHEYQYSSPVYQAFHTRLEADQELLRNLEIIAKGKWYSIFARPFYWAARAFGPNFWENKKTR